MSATTDTLVKPATVADLAEVLARVNADGQRVCVVGGGTKAGWGNPGDRADLLLSTSGLCSRCDIDADDLTATVSAGVTVAEARAQAYAKGRVLPLDPGRPARATMGGVTATGDLGARSAGYGRVRDMVLGLKAVLADGTVVKFGGRTMKNVAGYDMTKLFVGSFGVLGVVTETTFRLLPQPDSQGLMVLPLASLAQGQEMAAKVLDSNLQPLVLEALSPQMVGWLRSALSSWCAGITNGLLMLVGFAGHPAALDRSLADVRGWSDFGNGAVLGDADAEEVLEALPDLGDTRGSTPARLKARALVPLSAVWGLARVAESLATGEGLPLAYRIGAARGLVDFWAGPHPSHENGPGSLTTWISALRQAAVACGGQLAVTDGRGLLSAGFDAWGDVGPSVRLMRAVKERFDPKHTLNAGRFVGGI